MEPLLSVLFFVAALAALVFYHQRQKARKEADEEHSKAQLERGRAMAERDSLQMELDSLAKFKTIRDLQTEEERARASTKALLSEASSQAQRVLAEASSEASAIRNEAEGLARSVKEAADREVAELRRATNDDLKGKREKVEAILISANQQAEHIIKEANARAEEIAGDAYRALKEVDGLKEVATAMRNVIEGYGDRYLKPTYSLLDELADAYGFDEAGKELKQARERSKLLVDHSRAATCDYVEKNRRDTAIRFVVDAFNGKVDSILSRSKSDNYGTLEQQIRDAFALVNNNGAAFRNARITEEYLGSRLIELRWATAVIALREKEKEEQRRIREQIREEEKARREIEKALKESAREEEVLQKAMEKVQAQAAKANEEQKTEFLAKLAELQAKLAEAEARNQRALSMAQQTKAGHVYVISNIGSFGEDVLKVGMKRRLEPLDRIKELGDASVPFSFDVHAMIWSEDAPRLEQELHKLFVRNQVNKVNPRKEFFRLSVSTLKQKLEDMGVKTTWTIISEAAEYRESLAIEQRLNDSPELAEDWLRHQMEFVPDTGELLQAE